ncbi:uncharacterized protein LOC143597211 [Bidens hawaiensis]|uniref:uncharacterized protein LOC143597211 n=1 Tax=Bidens hawaiensis TaxID=980011 RepID=UPI0040495A07
MIPVEVGVPSPRITLPNDNDAERRLDLMPLEERRDLGAIREQNYKRQLQKYYNTKVKICEFNAGDYVLRNNEASRAHAQGKLAPSWEGPYQINKVLGKGAYTLMHLDGSAIPRTWNATLLRRCYMSIDSNCKNRPRVEFEWKRYSAFHKISIHFIYIQKVTSEQ